jgi:hypothetical protein
LYKQAEKGKNSEGDHKYSSETNLASGAAACSGAKAQLQGESKQHHCSQFEFIWLSAA